MHRKHVYAVVAIFALLPLAASFAQTTLEQKPIAPTPDQRPTPEMRREQREEVREELKQREPLGQDRCKNAASRVETRIQRFENNKEMFATTLGNTEKRLKRLESFLSQKGYDTTKLKADIETLTAKKDKLLADYDQIIATFKDVQACDGTTKVFEKVGEARKVAQVIIDDRADIREFMRSTLKADLMEIRGQVKEEAPQPKPTYNDPGDGTISSAPPVGAPTAVPAQ